MPKCSLADSKLCENYNCNNCIYYRRIMEPCRYFKEDHSSINCVRGYCKNEECSHSDEGEIRGSVCALCNLYKAKPYSASAVFDKIAAIPLINPVDSQTIKAGTIRLKLAIDKVIFHPPATIVLWKDGTKTVVKCKAGETYDTWSGLAFCICKKFMSEEEFHREFRKYCNVEVEE